MQAANTVAQCRWQTTFDDQSRAHQLQQRLSDFSRMQLPAIIDECLHQICPSGQVWRIETLVLDLGELAFDTLTADLPTKIARCLAEALERLKLAHQYQSQSQNQSPEQAQNPAPIDITILSKETAPMDYIGCFLQSGIAPWWAHTQQNSLDLFEQQLLVSPQGVAEVIRRVGVAEPVRKRLVWQWGESGVKRVIVVLEPYHHDYIVSFTEQLFRTQEKNNLPKSNSAMFQRYSWLWILTHLLVERGSLFNTRSFVGATLKKMARHFQIDYQQLLQQMIEVVNLQQRKGYLVPVFIQALIDLHQHNPVTDGVGPLATQKVDYWQRFNRSLDTKTPQTSLTLAELFMMLSAQSPGKMRTLLKKRGREIKTRQNLLRQFDQPALDRVVELLAPKEHQFILAHGKQSSALFTPAATNRLVVWEVILAYLLSDSGSHFNRRQFVDHTLHQISKSSKIDYLVLLDMLTGQVVDSTSRTAHFELLSIINQLKQLAGQDTRQQQAPCQIYQQALSVYLSEGKIVKVMDNLCLPTPQVMFTLLLKQQPKMLTQVIGNALKTIKRRYIGSDLGSASEAQVLAQRLLQMSVMADLKPLLQVIEPACMPFVAVFVEQLQQWQRQQYLPCLNGFDLYLQIYAVLLAILLDEHDHHFSVSGFLNRLTEVFTRAHGIDYQTWISQINQCVLQAPNNACGRQILGWINKALDQSKHKVGLQVANEPIKTADQWSWQDKSALLLSYLRGNKTRRRQLLQSWQNSKLTLNMLVSQVMQKQSQPRLWLNKLRLQHDSIALANALIELELPEVQTWVESLSVQRPDENRQWLNDWQNAITGAGLWAGSGALLHQKLVTIYRLCVLDLALNQADLNPTHLNQQHFFDALLKASCLHLRLDSVNGLNQLQTALQPTKLQQSRGQKAECSLSGHVFLCHYLLCHGRLPLWFNDEKEPNLRELINDLSQQQPRQLLDLIKSLGQNRAPMMRLQGVIDYPMLVELIERSHCAYKSRLSLLFALNQALQTLRITGIDEQAAPNLLWQKTLHCWLTDDWSSLSPAFLLNDLCDELSCRYAVAKPTVEAAFSPIKSAIPEPFSQAVGNKKQPVIKAPKMRKKMKTIPKQTALPVWIPVNNAGVVILQGFIKRLLAKQNLLNGEQFVDEQAQRDAVHFIQYLVTGRDYTQEQHLVLNKLLCGLNIDEPVEAGVDMTAAQIATSEGLLKAVIKYWPAIGDCSLAALRGNWLVRPGVLHHSEDKWELTVEKRPYDVLLERAPFSYSIINFPWMEKPLYVNYGNA